MTAFARQPPQFALFALAFACMMLPQSVSATLPQTPALPTISESTVIHDQAGIALSGFDPVAYFAEGRPVGGSASHELQYRGVVWRFASQANKSAFKRDPEIYTPLFGGYDPVAVAQGRAVDTSPEFFVIRDGHLMMFRNRDTRERLAQQPEIMMEARKNWPTVERQLAR